MKDEPLPIALPRVTKSDWDKVLKHWQNMSEQGWDSEDIPEGNACAFCRKFFPHPFYCMGCPIFKETGEECCVDTPFNNVSDIYLEIRDYIDNDQDAEKIQRTYKAACTKMYDWLKKLRKKQANFPERTRLRNQKK